MQVATSLFVLKDGDNSDSSSDAHPPELRLKPGLDFHPFSSILGSWVARDSAAAAADAAADAAVLAAGRNPWMKARPMLLLLLLCTNASMKDKISFRRFNAYHSAKSML